MYDKLTVTWVVRVMQAREHTEGAVSGGQRQTNCADEPSAGSEVADA